MSLDTPLSESRLHTLLRKFAHRCPTHASTANAILALQGAAQVAALQNLQHTFPSREIRQALDLLQRPPRPPPSPSELPQPSS